MAVVIKKEDILNDLVAGQSNKVEAQAVYQTDDITASEKSSPEYYEHGKLKFSLSSDLQYYICTGISDYAGGAIEIPLTYAHPVEDGGDGVILPVKEIASRAFENLHVENVTFKANSQGKYNVEKIGSYAFQKTNIKSIDIPSSVKEIEHNAFRQCYSLTTVKFNEGLEKIGSQAFYMCKAFTGEITFPDSLKSVIGGAFVDTAITEVTMGSGMTEVPNSMFDSCKSLTKVTLAEGTTRIGQNAFVSCSALTSINVPETVEWICKNAFGGCESLNSAVFEKPHGWFYTDLDSKPSTIISDENCVNIPTPAASLLRLNYRSKNWFRIGKIPTPTITLKDGVLTMTDYSGLADRFKIYLNNQELREATVQPIIKAGAWTARETFYFPENEIRAKINFTSTWGGKSKAFYGMVVIKYDTDKPGQLGYTTELLDSGEIHGAPFVQAYLPSAAGEEGWEHYGWSEAEAKNVVITQDTLVSQEFYDWFVTAFTKTDVAKTTIATGTWVTDLAPALPSTEMYAALKFKSTYEEEEKQFYGMGLFKQRLSDGEVVEALTYKVYDNSECTLGDSFVTVYCPNTIAENYGWWDWKLSAVVVQETTDVSPEFYHWFISNFEYRG